MITETIINRYFQFQKFECASYLQSVISANRKTLAHLYHEYDKERNKLKNLNRMLKILHENHSFSKGILPDDTPNKETEEKIQHDLVDLYSFMDADLQIKIVDQKKLILKIKNTIKNDSKKQKSMKFMCARQEKFQKLYDEVVKYSIEFLNENLK